MDGRRRSPGLVPDAQSGIRTHDGAVPRLLPDEERARDALAVGVLTRVEAATLVLHLAQHVIERLARDAGMILVTAAKPLLEIARHQQCVVVQHLLEVRHEPLTIGAVAVEAAAQLVVHAT